MVSTDLNSGVGAVMAETQVDLCIPRNLVTIGAAAAFFDAVFRGVHAVNRRAAPAHGYAAVAFPEYRIEGEGLKSWGNKLRLVGSEASLGSVLGDDRVLDLLSGQSPVVVPYAAVTGAAYAAFRDRGRERQSVGRVKRLIRRTERYGRPAEALRERYERLLRTSPPPQERVLHVDMVRHDLRVHIVPVSDVPETLAATTFGLSAKGGDAGPDHVVPFSLVSQPADVGDDPYAQFSDA